MGAAIFFAGQVWRPQKMAGGPRRGRRAAAAARKDGGGGAAPPARPQWRSFPGLGGPAARAGRGGARSGQRTARRLVVLGPRPPGSPRGPGLGARRGRWWWGGRISRRARPRVPPPPFPRLPVEGVAHPHAAPAPFPGPSTAPGRRLPKGAGAPGPFAPTHRAGRAPPAAALVFAGRDLGGTSGWRLRARPRPACHRVGPAWPALPRGASWTGATSVWRSLLALDDSGSFLSAVCLFANKLGGCTAK